MRANYRQQHCRDVAHNRTVGQVSPRNPLQCYWRWPTIPRFSRAVLSIRNVEETLLWFCPFLTFIWQLRVIIYSSLFVKWQLTEKERIIKQEIGAITSMAQKSYQVRQNCISSARFLLQSLLGGFMALSFPTALCEWLMGAVSLVRVCHILAKIGRILLRHCIMRMAITLWSVL